jgi:DNA-3-methyladenine glycosylase
VTGGHATGSTGPAPGDAGLGALRRGALDVAPLLLNAVVATEVDGERVAVRLTEVEAYEGARDPGSHGYRGRTARNSALFGPPGTLYVYFTYGMHFCANIVCGGDGVASAVLMRAGEVVEGRSTAAARRRGPARDRDLANGPAKLAQALGLDRRHDGAVLGTPAAALGTPAATLDGVAARAPAGMMRGPRVGVSGPGGGDAYAWRFWLPGEETVSRYRAAVARPPRGAAE